MSTPSLPAGWAEMTGKSVGSSVRDTNEPGGSTLKLNLDISVEGITNPMTFDFMDIGLPSLAASAYSTQLLAQKKWATQGVSRIISGDSITGQASNVPGAVYAQIAWIDRWGQRHRPHRDSLIKVGSRSGASPSSPLTARAFRTATA